MKSVSYRDNEYYIITGRNVYFIFFVKIELIIYRYYDLYLTRSLNAYITSTSFENFLFNPGFSEFKLMICLNVFAMLWLIRGAVVTGGTSDSCHRPRPWASNSSGPQSDAWTRKGNGW